MAVNQEKWVGVPFEARVVQHKKEGSVGSVLVVAVSDGDRRWCWCGVCSRRRLKEEERVCLFDIIMRVRVRGRVIYPNFSTWSLRFHVSKTSHNNFYI